MTGNPISRALFFWPGALLIRFGQRLLALSETGVGRYTLRPLFRVFCRFALYARPYVLRTSRTNDVVTPPQLDAPIGRHRLIAAIPCACRAGRPACRIPTHGEHDLDVCLSFGLAAIVTLVLGWYLTRRGSLLDAPWVFTGGDVLLIGSLVIVFFLLLAWLFLGIGPLLPHHSRPWGLSRMVEISGVATGEIKVAGVGGWIDTEYVWRLPVAPGELDAIVADFELEEVSAREVPGRFWRIFPPWWRPWHNASCRYLSTPSFPRAQRGPDGDHFFVMYDRGKERLYVWCKSNF